MGGALTSPHGHQRAAPSHARGMRRRLINGRPIDRHHSHAGSPRLVAARRLVVVPPEWRPDDKQSAAFAAAPSPGLKRPGRVTSRTLVHSLSHHSDRHERCHVQNQTRQRSIARMPSSRHLRFGTWMTAAERVVPRFCTGGIGCVGFGFRVEGSKNVVRRRAERARRGCPRERQARSGCRLGPDDLGLGRLWRVAPREPLGPEGSLRQEAQHAGVADAARGARRALPLGVGTAVLKRSSSLGTDGGNVRPRRVARASP